MGLVAIPLFLPSQVTIGGRYSLRRCLPSPQFLRFSPLSDLLLLEDKNMRRSLALPVISSPPLSPFLGVFYFGKCRFLVRSLSSRRLFRLFSLPADATFFYYMNLPLIFKSFFPVWSRRRSFHRVFFFPIRSLIPHFYISLTLSPFHLFPPWWFSFFCPLRGRCVSHRVP